MIQRQVSAAIIIVEVFVLSFASSARAEEPSKSLKQRLDKLVLDCYPSATEPGAAVLVTVDGKTVLRKGYGMADMEKGVKVTPDMIFRIASITKQFTSVSVLQLVQQGKVSLEDPITKYLPDFDTRGKTITVEHLLSHTSGLPNYTEGSAYEKGMTRDLKPAEIVKLVADKPLDFEPGSRFKYSNTNYVLLGMLIEKVSGRTYANNLKSSITKPLGLTDTRYSRNDGLTPRHARGYDQDSSGEWVPMRPLSMTQPFAAGAIESTVDDLAKWTHALAEGKALDPKLLERAWTPYKPSDRPSDYGYGWFIHTSSGERWIGHNGGINGFQSAAVWIPEKKVFVAILRNGLGGVAPDVLLGRLALEAVGRPESKRVAITLPTEALDRYVGVYALSPEVKFIISRKGNQLFAEAPNKSKVKLVAEAEDKFFSPESEVRFSFTIENGKATQMTLRRAGRDSIAKREE
ncbi:MAG: serine hydrolase [Planctomycetes bacterium]|nr:serine hydrolase [Planctomycetota bacterium]